MSHTMNHELLQAVTTGNRDLFEQVIGSNVIVTEAPLTGVTAEGNSVLHIAASHGFLELVEAICRVDGTLIRARNNYFDTPLICAARAGHDNVVAHFIRLAAAEHEANEALLGARNSDGASAMHEAVSNGHFAVLETLLLEEAWLGSTVNARGVSPLYLAVLSGRADMVQLLIEQSPEVVRSPAYYRRRARRRLRAGRRPATRWPAPRGQRCHRRRVPRRRCGRCAGRRDCGLCCTVRCSCSRGPIGGAPPAPPGRAAWPGGRPPGSQPPRSQPGSRPPVRARLEVVAPAGPAAAATRSAAHAREPGLVQQGLEGPCTQPAARTAWPGSWRRRGTAGSAFGPAG